MKEFWRYFFSPFVRPKLKFYIGKIAIGTPYFYPRRVVKDKNNPRNSKFVNKKIGFDFCQLGWKTKWSNTDYRYQWSPIISFVIFKWQLAITIAVDNPDHYWTSWLYYQNNTDKTKSKFDRIIQCQKEFSQNWESSKNGVKTKVNYYESILKKKYILKKIDEIREEKLNKIGI